MFNFNGLCLISTTANIAGIAINHTIKIARLSNSRTKCMKIMLALHRLRDGRSVI